MMTIIQWAVIIFASFAWSRVLLRFKDKRLTPGELLFWSGIWGAAIVIAVLPGIAAFISEWVGIRRPIDVAVYAGIILLFYMLFRLYVRVEQIDRNVTKLVRSIAISTPRKPQ